MPQNVCDLLLHANRSAGELSQSDIAKLISVHSRSNLWAGEATQEAIDDLQMQLIQRDKLVELSSYDLTNILSAFKVKGMKHSEELLYKLEPYILKQSYDQSLNLLAQISILNVYLARHEGSRAFLNTMVNFIAAQVNQQLIPVPVLVKTM